MFPSLDFLGWFKTSEKSKLDSSSKSFDILTQTNFEIFNETPLCLVVDPDAREQKTLPIKLYDNSATSEEGKIIYKWNELKYKIGAEESERLAIDEAKSTAATGNRSELLLH